MVEGRKRAQNYTNFIHLYFWNGTGLLHGWKAIPLRKKESRDDLSNSMLGWIFAFVCESRFWNDLSWKIHFWHERRSLCQHVSSYNWRDSSWIPDGLRIWMFDKYLHSSNVLYPHESRTFGSSRSRRTKKELNLESRLWFTIYFHSFWFLDKFIRFEIRYNYAPCWKRGDRNRLNSIEEIISKHDRRWSP